MSQIFSNRALSCVLCPVRFSNDTRENSAFEPGADFPFLENTAFFFFFFSFSFVFLIYRADQERAFLYLLQSLYVMAVMLLLGAAVTAPLAMTVSLVTVFK